MLQAIEIDHVHDFGINLIPNHRDRCGGLITWARRFAAKKWRFQSRPGASLRRWRPPRDRTSPSAAGHGWRPRLASRATRVADVMRALISDSIFKQPIQLRTV